MSGPHEAALHTRLVTCAEQPAAAEEGHEVAAEEGEREPQGRSRVRRSAITFVLDILSTRHTLEAF